MTATASTTKLATFKLSPSYLEGLDALAARYGLPDRTAVVRRLIDDALADERGGLPSVNQITTLMARLEEMDSPASRMAASRS